MEPMGPGCEAETEAAKFMGPGCEAGSEAAKFMGSIGNKFCST